MVYNVADRQRSDSWGRTVL